MRDGETGAHADVLSGGLRELSRHLAQLESEVGRVRAGVAERDQFIHALLEALPMPVMTLTPNGRVTHANAAATKLFEKPPSGHALPELTRVPDCLQAFDAAGTAARPRRSSVVFPRRTGPCTRCRSIRSIGMPVRRRGA